MDDSGNQYFYSFRFDTQKLPLFHAAFFPHGEKRALGINDGNPKSHPLKTMRFPLKINGTRVKTEIGFVKKNIKNILTQRMKSEAPVNCCCFRLVFIRRVRSQPPIIVQGLTVAPQLHQVAHQVMFERTGSLLFKSK